MGSGKSRTGATRRAVLVVGGVTVLASIWRQPSGHPAVATQVGNVLVDAAHPHPAAHPARPAHPAGTNRARSSTTSTTAARASR
jgi:hypothetical protein